MDAMRTLTEQPKSRPIEAVRDLRMPFERARQILFRVGVLVFSLSMIALGIENAICAHGVIFLYPQRPNPRFNTIPVLTFLPPIPWLAWIFGTILAACGAGLLLRRTRRTASMSVGWILFFCTLVLEVPKYAAVPQSMSPRTAVFEPLATL